MSRHRPVEMRILADRLGIVYAGDPFSEWGARAWRALAVGVLLHRAAELLGIDSMSALRRAEEVVLDVLRAEGVIPSAG